MITVAWIATVIMLKGWNEKEQMICRRKSMLNILKKIDNLFNNIFAYCSVLLLIVVIVTTTVQVFTRYILNASLSGTDEVARFAFVWMSMMGASICVRNHSHAVVSVLSDLLKKKPNLQKAHDVLIQVLIIVGAMALLIYGMQLVMATGAQRSAGLGIPMSFSYACVPVGAFGMVVNGIVNIIEDIVEMKGGEKV